MSEKTLVGAIAAAGTWLGQPKPATPAKLVEDALAGFQKAADNLAVAQEAIATQKGEHEAKLAEAAAGVSECTAQADRLTRVQARIQELIA